MALKQLVLGKKIEQRKAELTALLEQETGIETRAAQLEAAIDEAGTDEEMNLVEASIADHEQERAALAEQKTALEGEISALEGELAGLEQREPKPDPADAGEKRSEAGMQNGYYGTMSREDVRYLSRMDRREQARESLRDENVREFYRTVRDMVRSKRAVGEAQLIIPQTVIDRIQILIGDYGVMYNEVDVVPLNGTARVVLDGANPEAVWIEMCDPVEELDTAFKAVEVDGYKVGGYIPVCNAILEDSMINLVLYVERKIALSIAKALDTGILKGAGAAQKQPMGVEPNIAPENIIALDEDAVGGIFGDLFTHLALIDTGENEVGEIIAVMRRATYYRYIAPRLVIVNSGGTYTLPNIQQPTFAGLRVVFSQKVDSGKAVIGDFKSKYLLGERAGIKLASSTDVRFIEDQTVFKGTARYDGKPINLDEDGKTHDFLLVTFPEPAVNP